MTIDIEKIKKAEIDTVKYLVVSEGVGYVCDAWVTAFDSLEEAQENAVTQWGYLTRDEKKKTRVFVGYVKIDDLSEWAIDEDTGEIDWTSYEDIGQEYHYFDSNFEVEKEEREEEIDFQKQEVEVEYGEQFWDRIKQVVLTIDEVIELYYNEADFSLDEDYADNIFNIFDHLITGGWLVPLFDKSEQEIADIKGLPRMAD